MQKEILKVANLKCNGCANTVIRNLSEMEGVSEVMVRVDQDEVEFSYSGEPSELQNIKDRLHGLGYPEATDANGLLTRLKSFKSCMLGKIN